MSVAAALWLTASEAAAHLAVSEPAARSSQLKQGPCGGGASEPRGSEVHTFRPGQTITVQWDEFVDHPGHFRISFDPDGQDDFVDPAGFEDVSGGPAVLIDGIADRSGGGLYTQEVKLPDIECDNCTLQVIQVMSDKPPYGDGNDMYYQCVDLVLSVDGEVDPQEPAESSGGSGCDVGGAPTAGAAWLLALGLLLRRRR